MNLRGRDVNADILNPDMINPDMINPDMINGTLIGHGVDDHEQRQHHRRLRRGCSFFAAARCPAGFKTQLLLYKTYTTPVAKDCQLMQETQNVLIANIPNPSSATR